MFDGKQYLFTNNRDSNSDGDLNYPVKVSEEI
jgi:hypothetical protein